jgi:hypothetical protein
MTEDAARWMIGVAAGMAAALAARVQLLPDVIDLSIIPTGAGLGSLLACAVGSACHSTPTVSDAWRCSARSSAQGLPPLAWSWRR